MEAEEEVVVVQKARRGSTIQNKETEAPEEEEEMVVLLNTQKNLQQPNGKIFSAWIHTLRNVCSIPTLNQKNEFVWMFFFLCPTQPYFICYIYPCIYHLSHLWILK